MTNSKPDIGSLGWTDLTVPDAERIRDFYQAVVGWRAEPVDMDPAGAVAALFEPVSVK